MRANELTLPELVLLAQAVAADDAAHGKVLVDAELLMALVNHNDVLRSAHSIAAREGKDTSWATFSPRVGSVLAFHHDDVNAAKAILATLPPPPTEKTNVG